MSSDCVEDFAHIVDPLAASWCGDLGAVCQSLSDTALECAHNADMVFPAASLIKVPIVIELYRQAIDNQLSLSTPVRVTDQFRATGSGILQSLSSSVVLTLKDAAVLMMQLSDNTAANLLIAALGKNNVNQTMRRLGLSQTILCLDRIDPVRLKQPEDLALTTPRDMATLFWHLAVEDILTAATCREILSLMKRDHNRQRICGHLPFRSDLVIYHKTGTLHSVYHDVGLVCFCRGRFVISALTSGVNSCEDPRAPNCAEETIARIARWAFDQLDSRMPG